MSMNRFGFGLVLCGFFGACSDEDSEDRDDDPSEESEEEVESPEPESRAPSLSEETPAITSDYVVESFETSTGIRPIAWDRIGLCRISADASNDEKRSCTDYVESDSEVLAPGNYVLKVNLEVPNDDRQYPVRFVTGCRANGSEALRTERVNEGTVQAGSADHGYRFWSMDIAVPEDTWASDCVWRLETGDHVFRGAWRFSTE